MKISLPKGLLNRLMLLTGMSLVGAILLQAGIAFYTQGQAGQAAAERRAIAIAKTLASSSADHVVSSQFDALDNLLAASIEFDDVVELQILNDQGEVLSHFVKEKGGDSRRVFDKPGTRLSTPGDKNALVERLEIQGQIHLLAWEPIRSGMLVGWAVVQVDDSQLRDLQGGFVLSGAIAIVLSTLLAGLMTFLALRKPMASVREASQFATKLDSAEGSQLATKDNTLEIASLVSALNQTSTKLHQQRSELAWSIQQLQKQESILISRNQQLDTIFNLNPDGLVTLNGKQRIEHANAAFLSMLGWSLGDVKHMARSEFEERLRQACLEVQTGEPLLDARSPADDAEHAISRKLIHLKGAERRVLEIKSRHTQARDLSEVLYFRDITYEAEVNRLKDEFLAHAAHELRTPLTSIHGFGELLLQMDLDAQTQRELLETIYRHTEALIKIINELLDLSRLEARGAKDLQLEQFDLVSFTTGLVPALHLDQDRWPVRISGDDHARIVLADSSKLRQALINILNNAQKYSPQGGPILLNFVEKNQQVGVEIRDHGIGLSPGQLERIGQRFWRADKSGNIPGSGLGVGIVQDILKLHGGRLQIESELGKGSVFTLWLPRARPPA